MVAMWRPQSTGNPAVDRQLSMMADMINTALSQVNSLKGSQSKAITIDQVKKLIDPRNLVKEFQANGSAPLDLTGLLGVTGTPQVAGIPILTAVPAPNSPLFVNTAAVAVGGQLFINNNGVFVGNTVGLTSVAIAVPAGFAVAGSPLTSNGTITISISNAATVRSSLGIDPIATKKSNLAAAVAPTVNDDSSAGYAIGSIWIDTTADNIYIATDVTVGAALWRQLN